MKQVYEELLDRCRRASTREEQLKAWKNLIAYVEKEDTSFPVKECVARSVLLEWPYSQVATSVDEILDACGIVVTVSTCTRILKELTSKSSSLTKLPLPSVLQACWTTLQRLVLSSSSKEEENQQRFVKERMEMLPLVKMVLLLPQIISNACHALKVRLPLVATPTKFYPRLVECCCPRVQSHEDSLLYMQTLIKAMLASRKSDYVAMGLANQHPHPKLSTMDLSPRETANLLSSMLQHFVSSARQNEEVLDTCLQILKSSSIEHQEAFVQLVVFSSAKDQRLCPLIVRLLDQSGDGCLYSHLCDIADTWSQWTFCHQSDSQQQHYATQVLLYGLSQLKEETTTDSDDLTLALLQGVTHRLESFFPQTRQDGMRIAQQVAKRLGQDLNFEELEQQQQLDDDTPGVEATAAANSTIDQNSNNSQRASRLKKKKVKSRQLDPDADYDSDDDEQDDSGCSTDDNEESSHGDDSSLWEDGLIPYDLDDAEDDLAETQKPLHLLEALDLLRTAENHDHAYSRHETALQSLPDLIRKRPDDLPDVAVSLVLQLLRMENKFNIAGFAERKHESILALTIQEPLLVGQRLIEELFHDGGLSDRLNILAALQQAAYDLSGNKQIDERQVARTKK
jgi:hypothetical protein